MPKLQKQIESNLLNTITEKGGGGTNMSCCIKKIGLYISSVFEQNDTSQKSPSEISVTLSFQIKVPIIWKTEAFKIPYKVTAIYCVKTTTFQIKGNLI